MNITNKSMHIGRDIGMRKKLKKIIGIWTVICLGFAFSANFFVKYNVLAEEAEKISIVRENEIYCYDESGDEYVKINENVFPDEVLRDYIDANYGITTEEGIRVVYAYEMIDIDNTGGGYLAPEFDYYYYDYNNRKIINSLQGIETLKGLSDLRVMAGTLPDVDFENNKNLEYVEIIGNNLGTLDFSKNKELESLSVSADSASVVLGDNKKLAQLFIDAPVDSLNIDGCTGLIVFAVENSNLTAVDVSRLDNLKALNVSFNKKLTKVSLNSGLKKLWLHETGLSELDLSSCPSLCFVDVAYSPITTLNIDGTALADGSICLDENQKLISGREPMRISVLIRGEHSGTIDLNNIPSFDLSYWEAEGLRTVWIDNIKTLSYDDAGNTLYYNLDTLKAFYNSENGKGGTDVVYWMSDKVTENGEIVPQPNFCFSDIYECYGALTSMKLPDSNPGDDGVSSDERHYLKLIFDDVYKPVIYNGEKYYLRKNMEGHCWAVPLSEYLSPRWTEIVWIDDPEKVPSKTYCPSGNIYLAQLSGDDAGSPKAFLLKKEENGQCNMSEFFYDVSSSETYENGNEVKTYDYAHPLYINRGYLPAEIVEKYLGSPKEYTLGLAGAMFATYEGYDFYKNAAGDVRCYDSDGNPVINEFKCDGTYTYYFQLDGTAMKDRLSYHPDGEHVIYFDAEGHEVFSDFANVKKTISGEDVNDFCFFNVFGYMYVDVITYDKEGKNLYYANPYGVMEMGKWFQFSDTVKWADDTPAEGIAGGYGYANEDGTLMTNTQTYDWEGRSCYLQGNGVAAY